MANITRNGEALAWKLNPAIGTTRAIKETCSLIFRHAKTHHALAEAECNGTPFIQGESAAAFQVRQAAHERWVEKRQAEIEARITILVAKLPETDEGPIKVAFQGDPRGATVKLVMPGSLARMHDDWGRVGICVVP